MKRSFPTMAESIAAAPEKLANVKTEAEAIHNAIEMLGSIIQEMVLAMKEIESRVQQLEAAHQATTRNVSN